MLELYKNEYIKYEINNDCDIYFHYIHTNTVMYCNNQCLVSQEEDTDPMLSGVLLIVSILSAFYIRFVLLLLP